MSMMKTVDSIAERTRPRRITNPLIGDVVTFLKTTEQTGGESVLLELDLAPYGGKDNALHVHLRQDERFEVIRGELHVTIGDTTVKLGPSQSAIAPARSVHRYFSDSPERC